MPITDVVFTLSDIEPGFIPFSSLVIHPAPFAGVSLSAIRLLPHGGCKGMERIGLGQGLSS